MPAARAAPPDGGQRPRCSGGRGQGHEQGVRRRRGRAGGQRGRRGAASTAQRTEGRPHAPGPRQRGRGGRRARRRPPAAAGGEVGRRRADRELGPGREALPAAALSRAHRGRTRQYVQAGGREQRRRGAPRRRPPQLPRPPPPREGTGGAAARQRWPAASTRPQKRPQRGADAGGGGKGGASRGRPGRRLRRQAHVPEDNPQAARQTHPRPKAEGVRGAQRRRRAAAPP